MISMCWFCALAGVASTAVKPQAATRRAVRNDGTIESLPCCGGNATDPSNAIRACMDKLAARCLAKRRWERPIAGRPARRSLRVVGGATFNRTCDELSSLLQCCGRGAADSRRDVMSKTITPLAVLAVAGAIA